MTPSTKPVSTQPMHSPRAIVQAYARAMKTWGIPHDQLALALAPLNRKNKASRGHRVTHLRRCAVVCCTTMMGSLWTRSDIAEYMGISRAMVHYLEHSTTKTDGDHAIFRAVRNELCASQQEVAL